jgi:transcriptional regulator with XRE-family HTH domain
LLRSSRKTNEVWRGGCHPGFRTRDVRKRRGLTQKELAAAVGVAVSTVKRIEQGIYGPVRLKMTRRLAVALDVPTSALMNGPDSPVASPASVLRWEPVA